MPQRKQKWEPQPRGSAVGEYILKWAPIAGIVISFLIGLMMNGINGTSWFFRNVATVPYVDQKHDEAMKYADSRASAALQQAIEHSDMNRQLQMTALAQQASDIKAQGATLQAVHDDLTVIKNDLLRKH